MPRGVCLVGFMGAGKTTVGRILAQLLEWSFVDIDERIARQQSRSVAELFQQSGEAVFRGLEQAALREVLLEFEDQPFVLSIGGGAFLQVESARALRSKHLLIVFLDAPADELYQRCVQENARRPLLRDPNHFRQLYDRRRSTYMEADMRVDTSRILPAEVAARVVSLLGLKDRS